MTPKNLLRPFANQRHIGRHLAPDGNAQDFPDFDILEFGKELQPAQGFEVPGILDRRVLVDQLIAHRRQILGHFGPFR